MRLFKTLIACLLLSSVVYAHEFHVDKSKNNQVRFVSKAPFDDFDGTTNKIDGYIYSEGEDLLEKSEIYFEVDLISIDTGIGLRNRHMRDNYLETDKFPLAYFKGALVTADKINQNEYKVTAEGEMFIHGIKKLLTITGQMIEKDSGYQMKAEFKISLPDYKIKIPKIMFFKINETVDVYVDFFVKMIDRRP